MNDPAQVNDNDRGESRDPELLRYFAVQDEPLPNAAFLAQLHARLQRQQHRQVAWRMTGALALALLGGWLLGPLATQGSLALSTQALRLLPTLDSLVLTPLGSLLLALVLGIGWRVLRR